MLNSFCKPLSGGKVLVAIAGVFAVVMIVVIFVLNNSTKKPQSPQAMVAAAMSSWFAPSEWQPGMGPKPLIYHPAAQQQLIWQPMPGSPAAEPGRPKFDSDWRPLPGAQAAPQRGGGQGGIQAYTGPVR